MAYKQTIFEAKIKQDKPLFVADYYVYTDGSCSNNGSESAQAGMGVYFGPDDPRNVSKRVVGKQSNNTAELGAIIEAYRIIEKDVMAGKKVGVVADSIYAIRAATTYGETCNAKGWSKDIPNKEMVQLAYSLYKDKPNIEFIHVKGHTEGTDPHSVGNDGADKLANQAIGLTSCPYAESNTKLYLNVPFARKEEAKRLGAMWDAENKKWYMKENNKNKMELIEKFNC